MCLVSTRTILTLDRYAKILGINPLSMSGAIVQGIENPIAIRGAKCNDVWFQHAWQSNDMVSREDLAMQMAGAETQIRDYLGYNIAPVWTEGEVYGIRDEYKFLMDATPKIRLDNSYLTKIGQRKKTLIATVDTSDNSLEYVDNDSDTFSETAVITFTLPDTMTYHIGNIKVYTHNKEAEDEWEIRYPKKFSKVGNTVTLEFDSWLMIEPDLWEMYPLSDGTIAIDCTSGDKFVDSVDIYYEEVDATLPAVIFYWDIHGVKYTQNGWFKVTGKHREFAYIYPAEYHNGEYVPVAFTQTRAPDYVELYYQSGLYHPKWYGNKRADPLMDDFAEMVAYLATARVERPFCGCGNLSDMSEYLMRDLAARKPGDVSQTLTYKQLDNPFGTRQGEVLVFTKLSKTKTRVKNAGGAV